MNTLFSLIAPFCLCAQPPAPEQTIPGITLWVYDLGGPLSESRLPTVAEGQTPNHYSIAQHIAFDKGFDTPGGQLKENFAGEVRGWLKIDEPGSYAFRLRGDDGAQLYLDGMLITDSQTAGEFQADGAAALQPGLRTLSIPFYQRGGGFNLKLQWRPPGETKFSDIPEASLRTEPGQTFAVSPGPKRWFYGRDPNRPGDGRPLETVHPSFTLEDFRGPDFRPPVGAMCFLPDGRLAIATWDPSGSVYFVGNLDKKAGPEVTLTRFAAGLGEPLGMAWYKGDLYVTQKQEVTRLRDTDGDGTADEYAAIATWPASSNYHEFSFNLLPLDGRFFVTTSVPLKSGNTAYTPAPGANSAFGVPEGPGSVLSIDPATGIAEVFANGLRAPNGMGLGPDGHMYCSDNQGCWLPASRLNLIRKGGFYGHQRTPDGAVQSDPPVVWFPHGEIGNSPSEPLLIPDGPYRRQMLVGDVTHGGINRVFIENVGTENDSMYQGCVFQFSQGLEAGVNRMVWGPDGCLYVGGVGSNGNWHHKNKKFGLQRLRPSGQVPLEILRMESRRDGFELTFTEPVDAQALRNPESYAASTWRYIPTIEYGGPKVDLAALSITDVQISADHRRAFLSMPDLKPDSVVYLRLRNIKSQAGEDPFTTEAWYTLNRLGKASGLADHANPPSEAPDPKAPAGATVLFDGTNLDAFTHADGKAPAWTIDRGQLMVNQAAGDLFSKQAFGDCRIHLEWLSPAGGPIEQQRNGNSGVKPQSRYEVQIMNSAAAPHPAKFNESGSIYRQKPADMNASLGAGVWQAYDIVFTAPRWNSQGKKTANARMTLWWNGHLVQNDVEITTKTGVSVEESPGDHPLLLQAHPSDASGEVRYRNIWILPGNDVGQ